jgi:hypothetical protein
MNPRSPADVDSREALLARMATSRADLLATNRKVQAIAVSRKTTLTPANLPAFVATAPNALFLIAIVVGSLILGPRKIVAVAVRNGLTAWIAKMVRRLVGR